MKLASERKARANRANAQASTGPKTAHGRTRSARNATRHALSISVYSDPVLSEAIEALVREIAGANADAEMRELARRIAEAQIDLHRVRYARHQLLHRASSDPCHDSHANMRQQMASLDPNPPDVTPESLAKFLISTPEGPEKFATIVSQQTSRPRH